MKKGQRAFASCTEKEILRDEDAFTSLFIESLYRQKLTNDWITSLLVFFDWLSKAFLVLKNSVLVKNKVKNVKK